MKRTLDLFLCLDNLSVACSIIDIDVLVVSPNHAATQIHSISYLFVKEEEKNLLNCFMICYRQSVVVYSVGRQFVNEYLRRASPSLRGNILVCVLLSVVYSARACQDVCISMCVFFSDYGFFKLIVHVCHSLSLSNKDFPARLQSLCARLSSLCNCSFRMCQWTE